MADMDAMDTGVEELSHDPGVRASIGLVQADDARSDEDTWRGMTAPCRPAVLDAAHEFAQLREIHGSMFEIHGDGISVGASHSHALRIRIDARTKPGASVVHRLVVFPQLDHFVEAARLVIIVDARRLDSGED